MSLAPLLIWLVTLPVRFTWELTPTTFLALFTVLTNVAYLAFYLMDRAVLRQARIDTSTLESYILLGPLVYLVRRAREAGQYWGMPVIWVVGFLVAVLV